LLPDSIEFDHMKILINRIATKPHYNNAAIAPSTVRPTRLAGFYTLGERKQKSPKNWGFFHHPALA